MAFNPENWKRVMGSTKNIRRYSEKIVMKDEYGDTLSFEVDEGDDGDYDNSLYMVAHEGDSNNVIEWRFTREELHQLIQYLVDVTKPDDREEPDEPVDVYDVPTNEDVIEHIDELADKINQLLANFVVKTRS